MRFDTLALLPATERVGFQYRVFGHDLLIGYAADRLYLSDTAADSILVVNFHGDVVGALGTPFASQEVPEDVKEEGIREVRQPDGSTRFEAGFSHYPDSLPRVARLIVDEEDHLWVMRYPLPREPFYTWHLSSTEYWHVPPEGAEWKVMSPSGELVGQVRTPPGLFVLEIGSDYLLGVARDAYDVEEVRLHRLMRR